MKICIGIVEHDLVKHIPSDIMQNLKGNFVGNMEGFE